MIAKPAILSTFLCLFLNVIQAQKTNFSGTWIFKDQQSISGKMYSNGVQKQMKISQTKSTLTIEKTTAGADNTDFTSTETIPMDGTAFETKSTSGRKKLITIKWTGDGKGFTEVANLYSKTDPDHLDFTTTDEYSLSEDGKTLTMIRKAENFMNGEVWQSKASYEKQ